MKNNNILEKALRLYREGFAVLWLHPNSKAPVEPGWTTGPRKKWGYLKRTYRPGLNVGVRLGTPSKLQDGYLTIIDVDVKSKKEIHLKEALGCARKLVELKTCPMVKSGRGNGSRHYYCVSRMPFKGYDAGHSDEIVKVHMPSAQPSKKETLSLSSKEIKSGLRLRRAWEVSVMSEGRQVVIPPSVHPDSGKEYAWAREFSSPLPVFVPARAEKSEKTGEAEKGLTDFAATAVDIAWLDISEKVRKGILTGEGVSDRSAFLMKASAALFSAGLDRNEVLSVLTDRKTYLGEVGYDHAKTNNRARAAEWVERYTVRRVSEEKGSVEVFSTPPAPAKKLSKEEKEAQDKSLASDITWKQDLDYTKEGKPRGTLRNVDLILSNEIDKNVFIEDLFASRIRYGASVPWGKKKGKDVEDIDFLLAKRWLSENYGIEPATSTVQEGVCVIAHRQGVHPVRDWLSELKWDGVERIDTWIKDYCAGEAEEPYLSAVSRKFLVAMVKRVFEPGCQWDYVLVLEGAQGQFKSSIARAIASDRWFMDNIPDLRDKDSMLNLQGKWLVELAELADVKRADYNQVKAYLTRRFDLVRRHYGRIHSEIPRQSVFIGTINEGQYLKDPTGNRRYWPVRVGRCDVKGITEVRSQLFAEAVVKYRAGEILTLENPKAHEQARSSQESRKIDDEQSELKDTLLHFFETESGRKFPFGRFKTSDLMTENGPWRQWSGSRGYLMNIAAHVLTEIGFHRYKGHAGARLWRPESFKAFSEKYGFFPAASGGTDPSKDEIEDFF